MIALGLLRLAQRASTGVASGARRRFSAVRVT